MSFQTQTIKPLGITLGDPAGIGAEVTLRALTLIPDALRAQVVLYGHAASLEAHRGLLVARASHLPIDRRPLSILKHPHDPHPPDVLGIVDVTEKVAQKSAQIAPVAPGQPSVQGALIQYQSLLCAIDDARQGALRAIVTAPWTKHILALAGLPATGHTEVLGLRAGVAHPVMMLAGDTLRVVLATVHRPLSEVAGALTADVLAHTLDAVALHAAPLYRFTKPRVAVCGLNPHAGEHGTLGHEDDDVIRPAIEAARVRHPWAIFSGPHPADTLFSRVVHQGTADFVVAMYHDQGLGPLKLWHHRRAANITLGLPFIRTSPDHGSAYDIAGLAQADPASMSYAIEAAAQFTK